MPDEEKRDDNLHELDREPASGTVNESGNESSEFEQRAHVAWGGEKKTDEEPKDTIGSSDTDKTDDGTSSDNRPLSPLHDDIRPATIPMPLHRNTTPPDQTTAAVVNEELPKPGPGLMVLQWLTYAFWGWTVSSLSGLVLIVVSFLLNRNVNDWVGGIAYLLSAVIVLFIIALVTDVFYAKAEKRHVRTSGSNVIAIIHAVLFALFAIGSLIAAVFGLVSLLIGDASGGTGPVTAIISGSVIAILFGMTLLRTLRPQWLKSVVLMYWMIMSVAVIIAVALAVMGPVVQARLQNEDKLVERGLSLLSADINSYTSKHDKLPGTLNDLTFNSQASKQIVDQHKVTYEPREQIKPTVSKYGAGSVSSFYTKQTPVYHYRLCVDYQAKDDSPTYDAYNSSGSDQKYPIGVTTYGHKAGNVCYDLQTGYVYNY